MQTDLLSFFTQPTDSRPPVTKPTESEQTTPRHGGKSPIKQPREDEPISEPTKECTTGQKVGEAGDLLRPQSCQLFESSEEESLKRLDPRSDFEQTQSSQLASQTQPSQTSSKSNARRRSIRDTFTTERKRRRNDASENERESISPSADCVRAVPPYSQGELPNAPRKIMASHRSTSSIGELTAILKDESTLDDPLDDTLLSRMDQLDLCPPASSSVEQLEDISEHHESAARCVEDILLENSQAVPDDLDFEKAILPAPMADSDDSLLNHYLYQIPHLRDNLMWTKFVEMYYRYKMIFCIPSWINPQRMRDFNKRPVEDPEFDLGHILWPGNVKQSVDDKMHFTPAMVQYWDIKTQNFDSIIFFKLGKFYELFYTDSMIAQELLGLKWMGNDSKSHVGFPESSLTSYGKQLVDYGLRVCVVEQMETPNELHQRKSISACDDQAVRRSICEIYTKGTITHERMLGPLPSYLVSMFLSRVAGKPREWALAIIALDVACCQGYYKVLIESESGFYNIRNFVAQWPPREAIIDAAPGANEDSTKLRSVIAGLDNSPVITKGIKSAQRVHTRVLAEDRVLSFFKEQEKFISWVKNCEDEGPLRCLEQLISHLDSTLLTERIIKYSRFSEFPNQQNYLAMNSASIHTLDLIPGLYGVINHTATKFGQRMLRQWLSQPLLSKEPIEGRQNAIQTLLNDAELRDSLIKALKKLPDVERSFARISSQILRQKDSNSQGESKQQGPVYFTETISKRISEFIAFLGSLIHLDQIISMIRNYCQDVDQNNRLSDIVYRLFPMERLCELANRVLSVTDSEACVPISGVDEDFDNGCRLVRQKEKEIQNYLKTGEVWQDLGIKKKMAADYVTSKYRYEIEITDSDWKKISSNSDAQMTSTRKGWVRFHTPYIRAALNELISFEAERDLCLWPWLSREIANVNADAPLICQCISLVGEIDCLVSLAQYALSLKAMTFPTISEENLPSASFKKCYHPILAQAQSNFIPNDIEVLAGKPIVLTGPNMGGKSTLSRQVALLVILAQIGSALPAQGPCQVSLFDKVFTRIGLKDALSQAKSTFLIELEDVYEMLQQASPKSLLVIDEFGRGTSSKEGALLAASTLYHITKQLRSACLFSTHFPINHIIEVMTQNHIADRQVVENIQYKHLGAFISNENLIFTYKLADGVFPESHGIRVAEIAGIPKSVLKLGLDTSIAV